MGSWVFFDVCLEKSVSNVCQCADWSGNHSAQTIKTACIRVGNRSRANDPVEMQGIPIDGMPWENWMTACHWLTIGIVQEGMVHSVCLPGIGLDIAWECQWNHCPSLPMDLQFGALAPPKSFPNLSYLVPLPRCQLHLFRAFFLLTSLEA